MTVIGTFRQTVDFDPGVGINSITAPGGSVSTCIVQYDQSGVLQWAGSYDYAGAFGAAYGDALSEAPDGSFVTTGRFSGAVDFDPGSGTNILTSSPNTTFLASIQGDGTFGGWAASVGGGYSFSGNFSDPVEFTDVACHSDGSVISCGMFSYTQDFDPTSGTSLMTSWGSNHDAYVAKYGPLSTGIIEESQVNPTLIAFPNPTEATVNILVGHAGKQWSVHSALGEAVLSGLTSSEVESIDLTPFAEGIYQFAVEGGGAVRLLKR